MHTSSKQQENCAAKMFELISTLDIEQDVCVCLYTKINSEQLSKENLTSFQAGILMRLSSCPKKT